MIALTPEKLEVLSYLFLSCFRCSFSRDEQLDDTAEFRRSREDHPVSATGDPEVQAGD